MESGQSDHPDDFGGTLMQPRHIGDLLNYRMARLNAFASTAVIRLCEGRYGISRRQWHIIALLAAHGPQAPSTLADMSHLDRARVSRAATELLDKRLIERAARPGDRRRAIFTLTESGRRLYDKLFKEAAALNVALVAGIDPGLRDSFDRALDQLGERARILAQQALPDVHADRWRGGSQRRSWQDDGDNDE